MGTWDDAPWDNDEAADWFGDFFEQSKIAERIAETLKLEVKEHHREVRAAASVLIFLGRSYVWPIDRLDDDLRLAISRLEAIANMPDADDVVSVGAVQRDIAILQVRLHRSDSRKHELQAKAAWETLR